MKCKKFSTVFREKRFAQSSPEDNSWCKLEKISHLVDFVGFADYWQKLKEYEKLDKYLDLKMIWNMKVVVIPIIAGALGTIIKGLEKRLKKLEMRGRFKIIQLTALLNSARIQEESWRIAVTQNSTQNQQLEPIGKTSKK